MKKSIREVMFALAVATTSTTYVSCSTMAGQSFRDAAIDGAAGVIEQTVADWLGTVLEIPAGE